MEMPRLLGEHEAPAAASEHSASSVISTPPALSPPRSADNIHVASRFPRLGEDGGNVASATSAYQYTAAATQALQNITSHDTNGSGNGAAAPSTDGKAKRVRKATEKALGPDGKPVVKRTRAPNKPKDPTRAAATTANGTTTTVARKRQKTEDKKPQELNVTVSPPPAPAPSRQPTLYELVRNPPPLTPRAQANMQYPPRPVPQTGTVPNSLAPSSHSLAPRPLSSGKAYDPVRGYDSPRTTNADAAQSTRASTFNNGTPVAQYPPHLNRASASPSIASLIHPTSDVIAPTFHYGSHHNTSMQPPPTATSLPHSPVQAKPAIALTSAPPHPSPHRSPAPPADIPIMDGAMEIDSLVCDAPSITKPAPPPAIAAPSKPSSATSTPKPATRRPTPPLIGTGSGLLSSSSLFGGPPSADATSNKGVTIDLHIPLNPNGGNTINIAREILAKYGRDAINPRLAEHRRHLLAVAAAAHALENPNAAADPNSALNLGLSATEDMDVDSDSPSGTDKGFTAAGVPRQRRQKIEEYDKEDEFIDDTELAWQEQAAVAKDGFFVYSGLLVPEGTKAEVESATTRGGRGGRGRGARGGRGGTTTTHASTEKDKKEVGGAATTTRGRGRGRGTGAPRAPRKTKAEKEKADAEKAKMEVASGDLVPPLMVGATG